MRPKAERTARIPSAPLDAGQALAELVIVVPMLLLLLIAAIDFGRYMHDGIEVSNAARAAVQYGAQNMLTSTDTSGIKAAAQSDASDIAGLTVSASNYCTCDQAPGVQYQTCSAMPPCDPTDHADVYVKVVANKIFTPLLAYPGIPAPLTISRTATQQVTP